MRKFSKKTLALAVSLALLLVVGVGGTLAYLLATDGPLNNTFTPSKVTTAVTENFQNGVKSNVMIQNTGDTEAYIRAAVVVTWQNANGEVYGQMPVAGTDYTLTFSTDDTDGKEGKWVKNGDFYYWTKSVPPQTEAETVADCHTGILITNCESLGTAPTGYELCVEILGSGIQSVGTIGTVSAVVDAWGVDPSALN